jgi:hypothetical protein
MPVDGDKPYTPDETCAAKRLAARHAKLRGLHFHTFTEWLNKNYSSII